MSSPIVLIITGSKSDSEYAEKCQALLTQLGIESKFTVSSAHRHPVKTADIAKNAANDGFKIIIAMAGLSAALPGVMAAHSDLPVIGVPIPASIGGIDSLLSIAQMPPGIPVACMGIGNSGAKNAAVLAARILALGDSTVERKLGDYRDSL
ncbi:MAG: 5-(carboxyamino)imidazole ribonucleotide mutase [candidate division Zixibacteria bacterium]|nr:5-(carboxyamino)imidazole ribonucleotide mutase [candidate division Zixibacteria bacterium]